MLTTARAEAELGRKGTRCDHAGEGGEVAASAGRVFGGAGDRADAAGSSGEGRAGREHPAETGRSAITALAGGG